MQLPEPILKSQQVHPGDIRSLEVCQLPLLVQCVPKVIIRPTIMSYLADQSPAAPGTLHTDCIAPWAGLYAACVARPLPSVALFQGPHPTEILVSSPTSDMNAVFVLKGVSPTTQSQRC